MASPQTESLLNTRRSVFYFSYVFGTNEGQDDFRKALREVIPNSHGAVGSIRKENGERVLDLVLSVGERIRVSTFYNGRKWRRAGASGYLTGVTYPKPRESSRQFLVRYAKAVARARVEDPKRRPYGSQRELYSVYDDFADREAKRVNSKRKREPSQRKRLSDSLPDEGEAESPEVTDERDVTEVLEAAASPQQEACHIAPVANGLSCDVKVDVNMDAELSMFLDMMDPGLETVECGFSSGTMFGDVYAPCGGEMNFAVDVNVDGVLDVSVDWDALVSDPGMQDIML